VTGWGVLSRIRLPAFAREVNWFVVVGAVATGCHVVTALSVQHLFKLGPLTANFCGYLVSVSVSYFGNALLTFRRPAMHGPQFVRFMAISLAALVLNQAIVFVCNKLLGWPLSICLIPVVLLVPTSTFLMSKIWAFRRPFAEPTG
jgi:putative flippase GtrA